MATSEEERQSWMRLIQKAMIGDEGPRKELDLTQHQEAVDLYQTMRQKILQADTKESYLEAVQSSMQLQEEEILCVPAEWIRDHTQQSMQQLLLEKTPSKRNIKPHRQLKSSIADFWNKMSQATFSVNGVMVPRDTPLASTRVIGALTRCILEYDKSYGASGATAQGEDEKAAETKVAGQMTELQAISYSRNILLAILRSKEEELVSTAVHHLLKNPELVVVSDKDGEDGDYIVNMEVSFAGEELPDDFLPPIADEMAGWMWIRRSKQPTKMNRKRYAVLSGAALTYYEAATPRPVGLRGQLLLRGASVTQRENESDSEQPFVLSVSTPSNQERILAFEQQEDLLEWKEAIQVAIDSCIEEADDVEKREGGEDHILDAGEYGEGAVGELLDRVVDTTPSGDSRSRNSIRRSAERLTLGASERVIKVSGGVAGKVAKVSGGVAGQVVKTGVGVTERVIKVSDEGIRGGMRVIKGAKDGGVKAIRSATDGSMKVLRGAYNTVGRVGRLRSSHSRSSSGSDFDSALDHSRRSRMTRRPSMQALLSNTALSDKREEPTVQCIFYTTQTFWIGTRNKETGEEERWISVSAKLYQAFLLLGGPSGRMARGDQLIELEFDETTDPAYGVFAF